MVNVVRFLFFLKNKFNHHCISSESTGNIVFAEFLNHIHQKSCVWRYTTSGSNFHLGSI